MRRNELLSREWCDLIFEGRNKEYGAYRLRKEAGKRYRRAMFVVLVVLLLLLSIPLAMGLYVKYTLANALEEVEGLVKMSPHELKQSPEFRRVSAGRRAVPMMKPGASMQKPELVDAIVPPKVLGVDGPVELTEEDFEQLLMDVDTLHNMAEVDRPVEGAQLVPTEKVEEIPHFPGGEGALMKWLDQHVIYPHSCIQRQIQGDVEVSFIVDVSGQVIDPEVTTSAHPDLDKAALIAVKRMPRWKPGTVNGKPTPVRITVPIHFEI